MSWNSWNKSLYVVISSDVQEAPIWMFSIIPSLIDISMGTVKEIFPKLISESEFVIDIGLWGSLT